MGQQHQLDESDQALLDNREAEMLASGELDETTMLDVGCVGQCHDCYFSEHCMF